MKLTNKKGFTLMEMLIVVAIIAILVAIAIPSFSSSLRKAKEAADCANIRAQYAEDLVEYLDKGSFTNSDYPNKDKLNYGDQLKTYKPDADTGVVTVYYEGKTIELELD